MATQDARAGGLWLATTSVWERYDRPWTSSQAAGDANLVRPLIEAVKAYATVGEICSVLRQVFGEYRPVPVY